MTLIATTVIRARTLFSCCRSQQVPTGVSADYLSETATRRYLALMGLAVPSW